MRTRALLIGSFVVQLALVRPDIVVALQSPTLGVRVTKPLTNDDVVQMVNAKFADSTIIKALCGGVGRRQGLQAMIGDGALCALANELRG